MIRKFALTLRHVAVILLAVGVVTLGAYAFSTSSLASSLSDDHGAPPAMMLTTDTSSTSRATSDIVLVDTASSDTSAAVVQSADASATTSMTQSTVRQGPPAGFGGHDEGGSLTQALIQIARNAGILLAVSAVVAVIQTVLKRRKRSRKLTMAPA